MKQLSLIIIFATLVLSCSKSPSFSRPLRELVPAQVGSFKMKDVLKSIPIAPPEQYQSGALHPTEQVVAQYETAGSSPVTLQVTNYPSAADAEKALQQMVENAKSLGNGAKVNESAGKRSGKKVVIEGVTPGYHAVLWTNVSVLFQVSGDNLKNVQDFEQSFP